MKPVTSVAEVRPSESRSAGARGRPAARRTAFGERRSISPRQNVGIAAWRRRAVPSSFLNKVGSASAYWWPVHRPPPVTHAPSANSPSSGTCRQPRIAGRKVECDSRDRRLPVGHCGPRRIRPSATAPDRRQAHCRCRGRNWRSCAAGAEMLKARPDDGLQRPEEHGHQASADLDGPLVHLPARCGRCRSRPRSPPALLWSPGARKNGSRRPPWRRWEVGPSARDRHGDLPNQRTFHRTAPWGGSGPVDIWKAVRQPRPGTTVRRSAPAPTPPPPNDHFDQRYEPVGRRPRKNAGNQRVLRPSGPSEGDKVARSPSRWSRKTNGYHRADRRRHAGPINAPRVLPPCEAAGQCRAVLKLRSLMTGGPRRRWQASRCPRRRMLYHRSGAHRAAAPRSAPKFGRPPWCTPSGAPRLSPRCSVAKI